MIKLVVGGLLLVGLAIALGSRVLATVFLLIGAGLVRGIGHMLVASPAPSMQSNRPPACRLVKQLVDRFRGAPGALRSAPVGAVRGVLVSAQAMPAGRPPSSSPTGGRPS